MDHNDDKKNHFQGTRDELMLNQKKMLTPSKKNFFLIREKILVQVPNIGISPLLPVTPVTRVIS
jgi:hypothetical protein